MPGSPSSSRAPYLVRDGGRVGLVLPAELLQVGYAAQLRDFLLSRFREITLVTFERSGVRRHPAGSRVVLRCGRCRVRRGSAPSISPMPTRARRPRDLERRIGARAAARKGEVDQVLPGPRRDPAAAHPQGIRHHDPARVHRRRRRRHRDGPQQLLHLHRCASRTSWGCGHIASRSSRAAPSCPAWSTTPTAGQAISRPGTGPGCSTPRRADRSRAGSRTSTPARPPACTAATSARIRKPWWSTPSLWIPDLFMLRQIHLAPRLTVNAAAATSTDTVHRVRLADRRRSTRPRLPRCSTTARHSPSPRSWAAVTVEASWSWNPAKPSSCPFPHRRMPTPNSPAMSIFC